MIAEQLFPHFGEAPGGKLGAFRMRMDAPDGMTLYLKDLAGERYHHPMPASALDILTTIGVETISALPGIPLLLTANKACNAIARQTRRGAGNIIACNINTSNRLYDDVLGKNLIVDDGLPDGTLLIGYSGRVMTSLAGAAFDAGVAIIIGREGPPVYVSDEDSASYYRIITVDG